MREDAAEIFNLFKDSVLRLGEKYGGKIIVEFPDNFTPPEHFEGIEDGESGICKDCFLRP